jgi:hypothetical protein
MAGCASEICIRNGHARTLGAIRRGVKRVWAGRYGNGANTMTSKNAAKEAEMIVRQISWLHVYCLELNVLEQPGMPEGRHQEIMALRQDAPQFFGLASSLLKCALILAFASCYWI